MSIRHRTVSYLHLNYFTNVIVNNNPITTIHNDSLFCSLIFLQFLSQLLSSHRLDSRGYRSDAHFWILTLDSSVFNARFPCFGFSVAFDSQFRFTVALTALFGGSPYEEAAWGFQSVACGRAGRSASDEINITKSEHQRTHTPIALATSDQFVNP